MNPYEGYRITSPYGPRIHPVTGAQQFHTGIDLASYHEAPIYAFASGEVIHAREGATGSGFGNFGVVVAILDRHGVLHGYAHLNRAAVTSGQTVKRGDLIGWQGNTGLVSPAPTPANPAAGSHLHYEVRLNGRGPSYGFGSHADPTLYLLTHPEATPEPDWKRGIHDEARRLGVITSDWSERLDEPAPVWMVLATHLNIQRQASSSKPPAGF